MSFNKAKQLGQYFTPIFLAKDIVFATENLYKKEALSVLEPAYGQGAFLSALIENKISFEDFLGVEIDRTLKNGFCGDNIRILNEDFTDIDPDKRYDLIITNPPYTRHHLLSQEQKEKMSLRIKEELGLSVNGLSGLHCYFLLLADKWLKDNGVAVWLLPSEFLDVNYGQQIKEYLINRVQLLQVHVYDTSSSSLFDEATVSSCVIVYRKAKPNFQDRISFSFGSSMDYPEKQKSVSNEELRERKKWLKLFDCKEKHKKTPETPSIADYFHIKRGIATGYNKYFILSKQEIERRGLPIECFTPIIENTRNVSNPIIELDEEGFPIIEKQLFVLNTGLSLSEIEEKYPRLYEYLLYGLDLGVKNRYLIGKRKIWYKQEARAPAPFYCSYMARKKDGKSFRFIWNKSNIIVSNNFLMLYPKPHLETAIRQRILTYEDVYNALLRIENDVFAEQARTYAEGLSKLEPTELGKVEFCLSL